MGNSPQPKTELGMGAQPGLRVTGAGSRNWPEIAFSALRRGGMVIADRLPSGVTRCRIAAPFHRLALTCMSRFRIVLLMATVAVFAAASVDAQITSAVEVARPDRVGQVIVSDEKLTADGFGLNVRPDPVDLRKLPPEIRERIKRFELVREAYLKEQEELRKRLRGAATEAERDQVRELIRQARLEWLERARQLREETLRRIRELPTVVPDMREVISDARENAREVRKRRGQD